MSDELIEVRNCSDELIEVRNCAESYLDNAKYHLLHSNYEKALSFANMARDEIDYIINRASQQNAHQTPETQAQSQLESNASALEQSDGDTPPAQAQVA